ncbi:MAG: DUF1501 domain-containing protein [Planctomycetes bacterium]|nr:DUF1501 domain-containing protein [Planctomycetota bacterium]
MPLHEIHGCTPSDHPRIDRRRLLQAGGTAMFGMGLADLLRLEAHADTARRRAKSVIFIFQSGGPSQHETFDPKPDAPDGIRGEYGTTQTALAGARFCEYLPRLAQRANLFSIVRTMHHPEDRQFRNEHNSCTYLLHAGLAQMPIGDSNASIVNPRQGRFEWPSIGSLIAYAAPTPPGVVLPAVVEIPRANNMRYPGRGSGILGPRYDRWGVDLAPVCRAPDPAGSCPNCFSHDDPNDAARAPGAGPNAWWNNTSCRNAEFHLPSLGEHGTISIPQLNDRASILQQLESMRRGFEAAPLETWDVHRERAMRLILSASRPGRHNPFDLTHESDRIRDLYGREEWGQAFLVARRLVESGVRMVQVNLRGWDTHQNAFRDLKGKLLPSLDHCLSGLLDDLHQRGLLDDTLIVMCGEMGRTPRISPIAVGGRNASGEIFTPGRHHWGDVFPCFFAGGGIRAGQIIGQTDRHGGVPITQAYTPEDLAATIFQCLGVGPHAEFRDAQARPYRIHRGQPIQALLG